MENFHPIFVHFPIALLLVSLFIETLAVISKRSAWHRISLWNLCLGAAGAAVAVLTGREAEETAKHSFQIEQVLELHEKIGYAVLGAVLFVAAWRLITRDRLSGRFRWAAWFLLAGACGAMVFSAHLGGRLVYEFGVGGSYGRSGGIQVVR